MAATQGMWALVLGLAGAAAADWRTPDPGGYITKTIHTYEENILTDIAYVVSDTVTMRTQFIVTLSDPEGVTSKADIKGIKALLDEAWKERRRVASINSIDGTSERVLPVGARFFLHSGNHYNVSIGYR